MAFPEPRTSNRLGRSRGRVLALCGVLWSCGCGGGAGSNPCEGVTCADRGFCVFEQGVAYCGCLPGYHPVGLSCEPNEATNPCRAVDCSGHGACVVVDGEPECRCALGYHHPADYLLLCVPDAADGPFDVGSCVPVGAEACNGLDDDCDGLTDEDCGGADADADAEVDAGSCGDGVRRAGVEDCDGDDLGGASCESLGYLAGTLSCSSACALDVSDCVACGDCRSCTRRDCYRDIWWWEDAACSEPSSGCRPCAHWGPASSTCPDESDPYCGFCNRNGDTSPYWNGGPCDWVENEYVENCEVCGRWECT